MPIVNSGAFLLQGLGEGGRPYVGAGYPEAFVQQDFGQAAHADASDADEIYVDGMLKINLIHEYPHFCVALRILFYSRG